jgi:hypothetical protein
LPLQRVEPDGGGLGGLCDFLDAIIAIITATATTATTIAKIYLDSIYIKNDFIGIFLIVARMSQFPLYTTLMANLPDKDLTVLQKSDLIKKISSIDSEAHELVYALIKSFYMENNGGDSLSIPYKGQLCKDKIDFDLLEMPNKLRQLLYKFITLHKKKLVEDEKIKEIQNI